MLVPFFSFVFLFTGPPAAAGCCFFSAVALVVLFTIIGADFGLGLLLVISLVVPLVFVAALLFSVLLLLLLLLLLSCFAAIIGGFVLSRFDLDVVVDVSDDDDDLGGGLPLEEEGFLFDVWTVKISDDGYDPHVFFK